MIDRAAATGTSMDGMCRVIALFLAIVGAGCDEPANQLEEGTHDAAPVIPAPVSARAVPGSFRFTANTRIVAGSHDSGTRWVAQWLRERLRENGNGSPTPESTDSGSIVLFLDPSAEPKGPESYSVTVAPDGVVIRAAEQAGLFYGAVTAWQLVTAGRKEAHGTAVPAVDITDFPRFRWRGLMLDPARHFMPAADVRRMIDWMALHKLNVLHWHLTDDQGWRLEIEQYPRLTDVGAWRTPAQASGGTSPPIRYGGYYTKDDVQGLVEYAARRHVTIVPEIEMPGHAQAAIAAYPALGTGDSPPALPVSPDWGIHDYLFNVEEPTFEVLENILDEVMAIFPGDFVHVGGDEAVKDRWERSERVQTRMHELGIMTEAELQSWFLRRIEAYLDRHGRRMVGWDEILEGGLPPKATVMSWRGLEGALEAARQGHDTILTPAPTLYFDHRQSELPGEPPGRGPVITLADVYAFEPMPDALEAGERQHVLGIQANLWSEHIRTPRRLAYMAFPRAAAVAELGWSQADRRSWPDFLERLAVQIGRYRSLGLPFATSAFDVRVQAAYAGRQDEVTVRLSNQAGFGTIRFSTDGSEVTLRSAPYEGAVTLPASATLETAVFHNGVELSRTGHGNVGLLATRRYSQQLTLCSANIALQLEDDAPAEGDRSVFLVDILNPCWIWLDVDLSRVGGIDVAVGQLPFNFQVAELRDRIELRRPDIDGGELEVRAGGCEGAVISKLPLRDAAGNDAVTSLSAELDAAPTSREDLCFRFNTTTIEPMWVIEHVTLHRRTSSNRR